MIQFRASKMLPIDFTETLTNSPNVIYIIFLLNIAFLVFHCFCIENKFTTWYEKTEFTFVFIFMVWRNDNIQIHNIKAVIFQSVLKFWDPADPPLLILITSEIVCDELWLGGQQQTGTPRNKLKTSLLQQHRENKNRIDLC